MNRTELLAIMASNILGTSGSLVTNGIQSQWQFNFSYKDALREANELLTKIEIEQPVAASFRGRKQHAEECRCERCDAARDAYVEDKELLQLQSGRWVKVAGGRQGEKTLIQLAELGQRYHELNVRYNSSLSANKKLLDSILSARKNIAEIMDLLDRKAQRASD